MKIFIIQLKFLIFLILVLPNIYGKEIKFSVSNIETEKYTYSFSGNDSTLPVTLLYFEGQVIGNKVLLRWGTATEINNFGFDIERTKLSTYSYQTIGFQPGHGNSNSPKHYIFWDSTITQPAIYVYRLKQIDNDGSFQYSDTIHINFYATSVEKFNSNYYSNNFILEQNFPNPFNPNTTISFRLNYSQNISLIIYDSMGKEVAKLIDNEFYYPGDYKINWDGKNDSNLLVNSGVYYYQLRYGNISYSRHMILIK